MELSEFITTTLTAIQKGVEDAIHAATEAGTSGAINPSFDRHNRSPNLVQKVTFDVAVTVSEKASKSASGGIQVAVLKMGGERAGAEESSRVSRIQFTIPLIPPVTAVLPEGGGKERRGR